MCEPTTIAFVASAALSAGTAYMSAQAEDQQASYTNKLAIQSAENANKAQIEDNKQLSMKQIQEDNATAQQIQGEQIKSAKAQSTAKVAAGEAGVGGLAIDNLLADFNRQELHFTDAAKYNNQMLDQQSTVDRQSVHNNTQSRRNNAAKSMTTGSNPWATALRIGGGVLDAGTKYKGWGT